MLNINERIIRQGCGLSRTYKDGYTYYISNAVLSLEQREGRHVFMAQVAGQYVYDVAVGFDQDGNLEFTHCVCPAHDNYPGYCKHIVAVLFELLERRPQVRPGSGDQNQLAREMLTMLEEDSSEPSQELALDITVHRRRGSIALSMKIGIDKLYVLRDFRELFSAMTSGQPLYFGKQFTFDPRRQRFAPQDQALMDWLREVYYMEKHSARGGYGGSRLVDKREILLPEAMMAKVMALLEGRRFNLEGDGKIAGAQLLREDIPLNFELCKDQGNLSLNVKIPGELEFLGGSLEFAVYRGNVYKLSPRQSKALRPMLYGLKRSGGKSIMLPREYREEFVSSMLPALKKAGEVSIDPALEEDFYQHPLVAKVWLDGSVEGVDAQVEFTYGQYSLNPFSAQQPERGDKILVRDVEGEGNLMALLERIGFTVRNGGLHLEGEDNVFSLFFQLAPALQELAEVYYSDRLGRAATVTRPTPRGRVSMTTGNLLEVDFQLEGVGQEELADVLLSLREKRKYHRLRDGSILALEQGGLEDMAELVEELDIKKADLARGSIEVPPYRAFALEHLLQGRGLSAFRRDRSFRELLARVLDNDTHHALPPDLEGVLRDYQKRGYQWLKTLAACNMGGILADEMGLGKTLQVLTLLQSELPMARPALVVVPTSLLYNWQAEVQRFVPKLRATVIAGTQEERRAAISDLSCDVAVTSYALLRRDIRHYQDKEFSWCVLDEAQYIKNPTSQTARAVKAIRSRYRLALTGTPIENSLIELWSIFDFLMPGFLWGHTKFVQRFAKPIQQDSDAKAAADLSRKLAPFVLRRLKKDVLRELPPKIEHTMLSELTREQKKVYLAWLARIRGEAAAAMAQEGFERSRIKILAGLTRLRQICCHPALFLENYAGGSGKLAQLREVAADSVGVGHRLLIFSQFTTMLNMIRGQLEEDGLDCFYLDGATPAEKRLEYVHAFNRGERDVFLISLKAGGTGLNLVGADTVIHYDLWWNPAVEDQASDRAHRIGQTQRVQVMKFIAMGTIDEKIYQLQQQKKELIDKVIDPSETLLTSLTEAELRAVLEI